MAKPNWLPELILFESFHGDWNKYLDTLYDGFTTDFLGDRPKFCGVRMGLKKHPVEEGKEATFWHMIQQGDVERDRTPDMRRCERIRWPRAIIDNHKDSAVKVWRNKRGNKSRILLLLEEERYLVVLADNKTYVLPWTAYLVERDHQLAKLAKEHQSYQEQNR